MTFLNPLYLLGLSLIAVPIIIHLWFRKRLKKIPFSSLRFLKKTEASRLGWRKLKDLLVLTFRVLFIAALFLSLAKPQLKGRLFTKNRLGSAVIIIDNSYSMAYGDNFLRAKDLAKELILFYSPHAEFAIVPLCEQVQGKPFWTNRHSALEQVKKVELSYYHGKLADVLVRLPPEHARYPLDIIYIGDGQELNFKDFPKDRLKSNRLYWLKVKTSGSNIGIKEVFLKDPARIAIDNYELCVNLANFSAKTWHGRVELKAADYYLEQACSIKPNLEQTVNFILPVTVQKGIIGLYDDSLKIDNNYYFSKRLPPKLKVLIIGKDKFLELGLKPSARLNVPFEITVVDKIGQTDLRKFNLLILDGLNSITNWERFKLEDFLNREDTGILCFLADEVNKELRDFIRHCAEVQQLVVPKGYMTLGWVDYNHPAFTLFKAEALLKGIKIFRYQKIAAAQGVVARMDNNDPLIIIDNNLAVIATRFNEQTTDIIYKPTYVPLIYRLIYSLVNREPDREFRIGERLTTHKTLRGPDQVQLIDGEFSRPGFYTLDAETIGVNPEPAEGNLRTLGEEGLKSLNVITLELRSGIIGTDLTNFLLYLAALALVFEIILLLVG